MTALAGEVITADRFNRLQPKSYLATCSVTTTGIITDGDVTGCTVTFSTDAANAVYEVTLVADMYFNGATAGAAANAGIAVDGAASTARALLGQNAGNTNDRTTATQVYRGTLAASGSHTIKMIATLSDVDMQVRATHSTILVKISEVI